MEEGWVVSQASTGTPRLPWSAPLPEVAAAYARLTDTPLLVIAAASAAPARITWSNDAAAELFAVASQDLLGVVLSDLVDDGGPRERAVPLLAALLNGARATHQPVTLRRSDGSEHRVAAHGVPVDEGTWVVALSDLEPQLRTEAHLGASQQRFRVLAEKSPVATFFSDVGLRLGYVNDRMAELFGVPAEEVSGTGWLSMVHDHDLPLVIEDMTAVLNGSSVDRTVRLLRGAERAVRLVRMQVTAVPVPGQGVGFVGTMDDITERRALEDELDYRAHHDLLTGLPNRTRMWSALTAELATGTDDLAVAFVDLDDFKIVNDTLGHRSGDTVLVEIAGRIGRALRSADSVFRFGGDEFVVLAHGVRTVADAERLAARLVSAVFTSVELATGPVDVSGSVGVVIATAQSDAESLLRDADIAMYQAKAAGRDCYALFDADAAAAMREGLVLAGDLRAALAAEELEVHYQPVVDLRNAGVAGIEALVRWTHPVRGPVPAETIVRVAEDNRLIDELGAWVLDRALQDLASLDRDLPGAAPAWVSVNVSPRQLPSGGLLPRVQESLASSGLGPERLKLEVTESDVMTGPQAATESLVRLGALGVRFAIDDFGTGYSNLTRLRDLPVSMLKIDRTFTCELEALPPLPPAGTAGDARRETLVGAVVGLGRALGLDLVAEGVETAATAAQLVAEGCALAQGYHFARPMPLAALRTWLVEGDWPAPAGVPGAGVTTARDGDS